MNFIRPRFGLIGALAALALARSQEPPAATQAAGPVVGALGSPEMIDFTGNDSFSVRVRYSLDSVPKGIIRLGFNTADAKSYRMIASHRVEKGSGEVELSASVTPIFWGEGRGFLAYANLSPDPHPKQWTPLTSHTKPIPIASSAGATTP